MTFSNPTQEVLDMLQYMRPFDSGAEVAFIQKYIEPLGVTFDKLLNGWKEIGNSPIIWSCHTDTVHRKSGRNQNIEVVNGIARLSKKSKASCLGADDTSGVWLMTEMMKAGVPGLYVFHAGEEWGGKGSKFLVKERPDLFKDKRFAIALDRRGTQDIITHQHGGRCCSEAFSESLAKILNADGFKYRSDSTGTFTDTANYTDIVGECTNLSVGYQSQHTSSETQDLVHLHRLKELLCKADFSSLVEKRKPGEKEIKTYDYQYGHWEAGRYRSWDGEEYNSYKGDSKTTTAQKGTVINLPALPSNSNSTVLVPVSDKGNSLYEPARTEESARLVNDYTTMNELVENMPDVAAYLLIQCGIDAEEFLSMSKQLGYSGGLG